MKAKQQRNRTIDTSQGAYDIHKDGKFHEEALKATAKKNDVRLVGVVDDIHIHITSRTVDLETSWMNFLMMNRKKTF